MRALKLPVSMLLLMFSFLEHYGLGLSSTRIDGAEFFAGTKSLTNEFVRLGYNMATFEKDDDPVHQDMNSPQGLLFALSLIRRTRRFGFCSWAPVCSSWVWVNRGTSMRSETNVLGCDRPYVREANLMVSRCILLTLVGLVLDVFNVLEQPADTLMNLHGRFVMMLDMAKAGFFSMNEVVRQSTLGSWHVAIATTHPHYVM